MQHAVTFNFSKHRQVQDALDRALDSLANAMPGELVSRVDRHLDRLLRKPGLGRSAAPSYTTEEAAALLSLGSGPSFSCRSLYVGRGDFPRDLLDAIDQAVRTDPACRATRDAMTESEAEIAKHSKLIGLVVAHGEDVEKAAWHGDPYAGDAELVFPTGNAFDRFMDALAAHEFASEDDRKIALEMGWPRTSPSEAPNL